MIFWCRNADLFFTCWIGSGGICIASFSEDSLATSAGVSIVEHFTGPFVYRYFGQSVRLLTVPNDFHPYHLLSAPYSVKSLPHGRQTRAGLCKVTDPPESSLKRI